jgi:hypothetical protein
MGTWSADLFKLAADPFERLALASWTIREDDGVYGKYWDVKMSQYIIIPIPSSARADDLDGPLALLDTRDEGLEGIFESLRNGAMSGEAPAYVENAALRILFELAAIPILTPAGRSAVTDRICT